MWDSGDDLYLGKENIKKSKVGGEEAIQPPSSGASELEEEEDSKLLDGGKKEEVDGEVFTIGLSSLGRRKLLQ